MGNASCTSSHYSAATNVVNGTITGHIPGYVDVGSQNRITKANSILTKLPRELVVFCLLPLLTVKSMVRLDSAYNGGCMGDLIVARVRLLYGSERNCTSVGNLRKEAWLLARSIYPANVKIFYGVSNKEIRQKREIVKMAKVVSLNYCWMLSAKAVATFVSGCENVITLDLSHCVVKFAILNGVAQHCPQLVSLYLSGAQKVSSAGLVCVLQQCAQLADLRLSHSSGPNFYELLEILSFGMRLHTLHLSGLLTVSNHTLMALGHPALTELDISDCRHAVGASSLLALADCCPSLRILNAACSVYAGPVHAPAVLPLAQQCAQLAVLDLSGYALLQPAAVVALAQHCACLRRLVLNRCHSVSDVVLLQIAVHCASLRELSVRNCPHVTAAGAAAFQGMCTRHCSIYFGDYSQTDL